MPELPEVETTRLGLEPHLQAQRIVGVVIRQPQLRWPIPLDLPQLLHNQIINSISRRAKYLLIECGNGTLILHLGMSGSLRILAADTKVEKHDHFDLLLGSGQIMRLRDPRRFGAVLWCAGDHASHPLLAQLGPEPLQDLFSAEYFYQNTRKRHAALKLVLMDQHFVVGVGNIYANEALYRAGIRPQLAADTLSKLRCAKLVREIRETLTEAIALGGSSLRDFVNSDGNPGYFQQHYWVYGRAGKPCLACGTLIRHLKQGQRSSFYCPVCQK